MKLRCGWSSASSSPVFGHHCHLPLLITRPSAAQPAAFDLTLLEFDVTKWWKGVRWNDRQSQNVFFPIETLSFGICSAVLFCFLFLFLRHVERHAKHLCRLRRIKVMQVIVSIKRHVKYSSKKAYLELECVFLSLSFFSGLQNDIYSR